MSKAKPITEAMAKKAADATCKGTIVVQGAICPKCNAFVYSRARHDFRWCPCKTMAVDGGFDYLKILGEFLKIEARRIKATRQQLFNDWNNEKDKFGIIEAKMGGK